MLLPARPSAPVGVRIALLLGAAALMAAGCARTPPGDEPRVIVLGIDGMDPRLLERFMDEGRLPHFQSLSAQGSYGRLLTTMPPLSPVAWSSFITGLDPSDHRVFDFVHRDPQTLLPYDSTYRVVEPGRALNVGSFVLPLSSGGVELLRQGRTLWQILEDAGVPTTVFRMPVNFPPVKSTGRALSGMGTPDILGTHGTFSFYTDRAQVDQFRIAEGNVHAVDVDDNHVHATLIGPKNTFRRTGSAGTSPDLTVAFDVFLDPQATVAKFVVQDTEFVLNEGEWSDWVPVRFDALPVVVSVGAVARFYLQQVRPDFRLYVTPLQIDPADPALPISTPASWSHELQRAMGYFYTQELPEDTKAFSRGIFSGLEFWAQTQFVYRETLRALDHLLGSFDRGFLFFYFSTVDQSSHMLYRYLDRDHPMYVKDEQLGDGIRTTYEEMDEALGRVLKVADERTTVIVMSDHGFSPFYWGVNLNSWLLEQGYLSLKDGADRKGTMFANVDWAHTTAYAVGLNGLYVNLRGREQNGIVAPGAEYESLLDRLERDLLAMRDSRNGRQPVTLAFRPRRASDGSIDAVAPDMVVGYNWGYRVSWESPLGGLPTDVFVDNTDAWSGDHSVDYRLVPGVLVTNRQISVNDPALSDLTVSILDEFGLRPLPAMIGRDVLAPIRRRMPRRVRHVRIATKTR